MKLTSTDMRAVSLGDHVYINDKGAKLYQQGQYAYAVEYYRLAAAMGNVHAVSNLGYCYLYGRDIPADTDTAIAYFQIAAARKDVDAAYKLGDIYSKDKWGRLDMELSIYYYRMAAGFIVDDPLEDMEDILWCKPLSFFPSLCFALGRELALGGHLNTDLRLAYQMLILADMGYQRAIENGDTMYISSLADVKTLLMDAQFDGIREQFEIDSENEFSDED